MLRTFTC